MPSDGAVSELCVACGKPVGEVWPCCFKCQQPVHSGKDPGECWVKHLEHCSSSYRRDEARLLAWNVGAESWRP